MDSEQKRALVESWYLTYADFLLRDACRYVDPHAAEEVVQETFCAVLKKQNLDQIEHPKTWLCQVERRVCRNWKRDQNKWDALLTKDGELPENGAEPWMDEADVETVYAGLIKDRDLHLRKLLSVDGYTNAEAAQALGITPAACQRRAYRVLQALRTKLEL